MTKEIDFIFDFGSPNAYLACKALAGVTERTGATVNFIPCLLGGIFKATGNQAPMIAYGGIKGKLEYSRLEMQRFIDKYKLTEYRFNSHFPVNTLMMMRAAIVAKDEGWLEKYIEAGLKCMWEDDKKMDDPEEFVSAFAEYDVDGKRLLELTTDPEVKAKLVKNTQDAVDHGAFGVPTFYIGDEMFFGKERIGQLEEMLAA